VIEFTHPTGGGGAVLPDHVHGRASLLWIVARRAAEGARSEDLANPLLLISTGGSLPAERDFNRIYAKAAREPVELWDLPEVNHTAAIRERPEEYQRRVVRFFDNALLG
jgi:hypothetical protein